MVTIETEKKKVLLDSLCTFSVFSLKEHCLMGIRGTVRRNQDGHFIHANVDLDIIITEEVSKLKLYIKDL